MRQARSRPRANSLFVSTLSQRARRARSNAPATSRDIARAGAGVESVSHIDHPAGTTLQVVGPIRSRLQILEGMAGGQTPVLPPAGILEEARKLLIGGEAP